MLKYWSLTILFLTGCNSPFIEVYPVEVNKHNKLCDSHGGTEFMLASRGASGGRTVYYIRTLYCHDGSQYKFTPEQEIIKMISSK